MKARRCSESDARPERKEVARTDFGSYTADLFHAWGRHRVPDRPGAVRLLVTEAAKRSSGFGTGRTFHRLLTACHFRSMAIQLGRARRTCGGVTGLVRLCPINARRVGRILYDSRRSARLTPTMSHGDGRACRSTII